MLPPPASPASVEPGLQPQQLLHLPQHQRMFTQWATGDAGQRELRLYYLDKEIAFDEPELFTWAQTLAAQSRFVAADALGWGQPGDWPRVRGLLQTLLDEGVLQPVPAEAADAPFDERILGDAGLQPSPLPPAPSARPRTWHELPGLMAELTGRPLEIGWLELVVPVFRVAHMSRDAEGRQVGESNAFPPALRTEVPTRWRTCIYAGSRFQDAKPMNVSALKAMRAHWGPMMAMLLQVRAAYLRRCPEARPDNGGWTVGHLERLSTAVLALPAYQLMRRERRVADGALHPVLSSMFRVTDGLRMTMHHMLFIPFGEPTRQPDSPMTAAEVHGYAERAFSLHSEHGVCAGPRAMIDEFLSVLIDGRTPRDGLPAELDPALQAAVQDIEPAIDYAMRGLQAYAAIFNLWPKAMRCYEQLHALLADWARDEPTAPVRALQGWLAPIVLRLRSATHLATEAWRADRERVYDDMHAQAARVIGAQVGGPALSARVARAEPDPAAQAALLAALVARVGAGHSLRQQQHRQRLALTVAQHLAEARVLLQAGTAAQAHINALLQREPPQQPFQLDDVDSYVQLVGQTDTRVPFLTHELTRELGLRIAVDAQRVALSPIEARPADAVR